MTSSPVVDLRDYRSFCFRGEGQANLVISAKHAATGSRIAKSERVNKYMERIITPFIEPQFRVNPHIVELKIRDVHHLAKVPSLPADEKVETFDELVQLPDELSFLPFSAIPKGTKRLGCLQMLDATSIPNTVLTKTENTITIEVKPKQGFFQNHPNFNVPYCNNCILQIEKCGSGRFSEMYDFCPLDLYSGNYGRMRHSLESLFRDPHRNLRVFVNGYLVHCDKKTVEQSDFDETFFPDRRAKLDDLYHALCLVLSGSDENSPFQLHDSSVLGQILTAQKIDSIGLGRAFSLYNALPGNVKAEILDKTRLARKGLDAILSPAKNDAQNLIERYLVSATMKDCSIMVSLKLVSPSSGEYPSDVVTLANGTRFAYSIKIVDLDPKTPKHIQNAYTRLSAGLKILRIGIEQGVRRKPCVPPESVENV
ncbi:unnamed protein product [Caenorhabditis auriculariae]|uniref:Inositol-pentakisphosphate 2-kinase n=1 Tax=Caenorhabditis auriculariae TaxID=2777116 RepID=A0A8S1HLH1_9PELO|nr:unnamed protein product [Caenorhabditis auriculariae]